MTSFERVNLEPQRVAQLIRRGRRLRSEAFASVVAGLFQDLRRLFDRGIVKLGPATLRSQNAAVSGGQGG